MSEITEYEKSIKNAMRALCQVCDTCEKEVQNSIDNEEKETLSKKQHEAVRMVGQISEDIMDAVEKIEGLSGVRCDEYHDE